MCSGPFFYIQSGWRRNYLTSPLLELDLDEQDEANQRHDHEESQEDAHVEVLRGLLRGGTEAHQVVKGAQLFTRRPTRESDSEKESFAS